MKNKEKRRDKKNKAGAEKKDSSSIIKTEPTNENPGPSSNESVENKQPGLAKHKPEASPGPPAGIKKPQTQIALEVSHPNSARTVEPSNGKDIEPPDDEESSGKYSKRQVKSNWSRYDEIIALEDSDDTPDYNYVLSLAGSSGSQFQFSDERFWGGDHVGDDANSVLQLDCDELARALQCVPLHRRLRVDNTVFSQRLLSEYEQVAKLLSAEYKPLRKPSAPSAVSEVTKEINSRLLAKLMGGDEDLDLVQIPNTGTGSDVPTGGTRKYDLAQHLPSELSLEDTAVDGGTEGELVDRLEECRVTDLDGVRTVEVEVAEGPSYKQEVLRAPPREEEGPPGVEEDLDSLLSLKSPVINTRILQDLILPVQVEESTVKPIIQPAPASVPPESIESLEDWLDGILDD